jgi:hemerythrin-like domain-containing protein
MRTIKELTNVLTGIIISEKNEKTEREIATHIIEFLFNEDNLIVPPKEDYDLRKKMFNDFFEWHKKQNYVSIKRDDFDEFLDSY